MKDKRKRLEDKLQQYLEESKAENDALKNLIMALQDEEIAMKKKSKHPEHKRRRSG